MNPIGRWLNDRSRSRLEAERELGVRLDALVEGLRDRLPPERHGYIAEYSGQAEWELAIETIWAEVEGGLVLTGAEQDELAALARHSAVNQALLRVPANPASRDIPQR
jgi:hypothetical protein